PQAGVEVRGGNYREGSGQGGGGVGGSWQPRRPFFVVTGGANCEVKVWGVDTQAGQGRSQLALGGYTVVGGRGFKIQDGDHSQHLTSLELVSETHMVCGFGGGALELWLIPFDARGRVATSRGPQQEFPEAHSGAVTSISISLALQHPRTGCVGRVLLTAAADCTVVRWHVGHSGLQPLKRFCLSRVAVNTALLPVPLKGGDNGQGSQHNVNLDDKSIRFIKNNSDRENMCFRVVAALDGAILTLEVAYVQELLGAWVEGGKKGSRKSLANALVGKPLAAFLPDSNKVNSERNRVTGPPEDPSRLDPWASIDVGGPNGKSAGHFKALGGLR
ncbi:unnamed protein product, partial [Choristocarpus tenellus]